MTIHRKICLFCDARYVFCLPCCLTSNRYCKHNWTSRFTLHRRVNKQATGRKQFLRKYDLFELILTILDSFLSDFRRKVITVCATYFVIKSFACCSYIAIMDYIWLQNSNYCLSTIHGFACEELCFLWLRNQSFKRCYMNFSLWIIGKGPSPKLMKYISKILHFIG